MSNEQWKRDRDGTLMVGPCSLEEAFEFAVQRDGLRIAVSVPNGDLVAVDAGGGAIFVRRLNTMTGQGGSRSGTGEWLDPDHYKGQWRPA